MNTSDDVHQKCNYPEKFKKEAQRKEGKPYPNGIATNNAVLGKVIVLL